MELETYDDRALMSSKRNRYPSESFFRAACQFKNSWNSLPTDAALPLEGGKMEMESFGVKSNSRKLDDDDPVVQVRSISLSLEEPLRTDALPFGCTRALTSYFSRPRVGNVSRRLLPIDRAGINNVHLVVRGRVRLCRVVVKFGTWETDSRAAVNVDGGPVAHKSATIDPRVATRREAFMKHKISAYGPELDGGV
ncbi:hypothetical protein ZHAS_00006552 [Anopheles sinensis]|uniref:Uncharacterized protein n=1 Tax=Anopheles sinensis TaxID=74873 RepID=A0A084VML7_ANOSI|nr:hypothetical protein ZHAS_00006552 [Anopheles sinensis]